MYVGSFWNKMAKPFPKEAGVHASELHERSEYNGLNIMLCVAPQFLDESLIELDPRRPTKNLENRIYVLSMWPRKPRLLPVSSAAWRR